MTLPGERWSIPCREGSLDRFFPIVGPPHYSYQMKCELGCGASLKKMAILNDVRMAPMALPEMACGWIGTRRRAWLGIDEATGGVIGTPEAARGAEATIAATIDRVPVQIAKNQHA